MAEIYVVTRSQEWFDGADESNKNIFIFLKKNMASNRKR